MISKEIFRYGLFLAAVSMALALPSYCTNDDMMSWQRGDEGTTWQEWTFDDLQTPISVSDYFNPYGTPTASVSGQNGSVAFGWYASLFSGDQQRYGIWAGDPIVFDLSIQNTPDANPYKIIWFEMEYRAVSMLLPELTLEGDYKVERFFYDSGKEYDDTGMLIDDWRTMTIGWKIYPNPNQENISFSLRGTGGFVNSVAVDTKCFPVPEPSTMIILGSGMIFTQVFRRRTVK